MKTNRPVSAPLSTAQASSIPTGFERPASCRLRRGRASKRSRSSGGASDPVDSEPAFWDLPGWDGDAFRDSIDDDSLAGAFGEEADSGSFEAEPFQPQRSADEPVRRLLSKQEERDLAVALRRATQELWSHMLQTRVGVLSVLEGAGNLASGSVEEGNWKGLEEQVHAAHAAFQRAQCATISESERETEEAVFNATLEVIRAGLLRIGRSFPRMNEVLDGFSAHRENLRRIRAGLREVFGVREGADSAVAADRSELRALEAELWIREPSLDVFFERLRELEQTYLRIREQLVLPNLGLVRHWASRFRFLGMEFEDLLQEGNLALMLAAESFDPDRGRFSTHASTKIRSGLFRVIDNQNSMIRLPVHVCEKLRKMRKVSAALGNVLGREASPEEMAAHLSWDAEYVRELIGIERSTRAMHRKARQDQTDCLERVPDLGWGTSDAANVEEASEGGREAALQPALARLEGRQREVVERLFGLNGRPEEDASEIAALLQLKVAEVRRLKNAALAGLLRSFEEFEAEGGSGPSWALTEEEIMHGIAA